MEHFFRMTSGGGGAEESSILWSTLKIIGRFMLGTPTVGSCILIVNLAMGSLHVRIDLSFFLKVRESFSRPGSRRRLAQEMGHGFVVSCGSGISTSLVVMN